MSLKDRSFSARKGAVCMELLCVCARSGAWGIFSVGEASRGLFSSRIERVLERRLKGFGLLFLVTFGLEGVGGSPVESTETLDLEGPPTGFLATLVDLSGLGSAEDSRLDLTSDGDETAMVLPIWEVSCAETLLGRSVSLDILSSAGDLAEVFEFGSVRLTRFEFFVALSLFLEKKPLRAGLCSLPRSAFCGASVASVTPSAVYCWRETVFLGRVVVVRWASSSVCAWLCGGSVSGGGGFLELNLNGERGDLGDLELKGDRGLSRNLGSVASLSAAVRGSVSVSGSGFDFLAMLGWVSGGQRVLIVARPPRRNPLLSRVKWCTAFQRTVRYLDCVTNWRRGCVD